MKAYQVKLTLYGTHRIEDPHTPSYMRGSMCDVVDVPSRQDVEVELTAETDEDARRLCLEYHYPESDLDIEDKSIKYFEDCGDVGGAEDPSYVYDDIIELN